MKNDVFTKIENLIKCQLDIKNVKLVGSGTEAFIDIINQLDLQSNDEIIIPSFLCEIIMIPIVKNKLKYKIVDIKKNSVVPSLEEYKKSYNNNTKVILISYIWGYVPLDLIEIIEWARDKNLIIIEDIASSYGISFKDKKLGTLGDYCFGSFGNGKVIDVGKYGFVASNNKIVDFNKMIGVSIINYNKIIKKIRNIKNKKTRKLFLINLFVLNPLFLKINYDDKSLVNLYNNLLNIENIIKNRSKITSRIINELKVLNKVSIIVPNNDNSFASRLPVLCYDISLYNKLKNNCCWVGSDYRFPISQLFDNELLENEKHISKNIFNILTNLNNNTLDLTIHIIKEYEYEK